MAGINWFDLVILLATAGAVYWGVRYGFVTQVLTNVGLFGGLFAGGWLFPHLLPIHDPTLLAIMNANLVLILAVYLALVGFYYGRRLHLSLGKGKLYWVDRGFSVAFTIASTLVVSWLVAAMLGRLPFAGLSNSANDSLIVQTLDNALPPVPAVLGEFSRLIDPNSTPQVFIKSSPHSSQATVKPPQAVSFNIDKAVASVVRITSFGCGGIVSGSGFVVDKDLVVTNAHVIAGVQHPVIKYNNQSLDGTLVLIDPDLDFAVLRVNGLAAPPLLLSATPTPVGTEAAILGYPGGNYEAEPGIVRSEFPAIGRNIYGLGAVARDVYELQADVTNGGSGGPVVLENGEVAGMLFARSDSLPHTAYALTSMSLLKEVVQAENSYQRVSSGACLAS